MQKSPNIFSRIWAAFIFLTRLPFWRLYQPPKEAYESVTEHWPLVGWLTSVIMAAVLYFIAPYNLLIAVVAAIAIRILVTGALHEDGLADFFDGFGGGHSREKILAIMKDSHIGTYGVLGLIIYIMFLAVSLFTLASLNPKFAAFSIVMADPFAKMLAAQTVMAMPYARKEEESKAINIYRRAKFPQFILLIVEGLVPLGLFIWLFSPSPADILILIAVPAILCTLLNLFIYRKIKGYTGDCNGAIFLLTELSIYITLVFLA
ncbi:MAG: adenosylcobinamide-GDP ribazoletransferase [Bacteroidales bacterium]|nr:adenosylcobinamide-GDP ribazoletransferase [Bacteroidales bacterium]